MTNYSTVNEMVKDVIGQEAADQVAKAKEATRLRDQLLAAKVSLGMTTKRLAKRMKCRQCYVDYLESCQDKDWTYPALIRYSRAVGLRIKITFEPLENGK